jgi:putative transposase
LKSGHLSGIRHSTVDALEQILVRDSLPRLLQGLFIMNYLPRLAPEFYRGDAVVHWTLPIAQRQTGWLTEKFHLRFREVLVHACAREQLLCPCYCLMPDHIHLLWMGLTVESDQRKGMVFFRTYTEPLLAPHRYQSQAHDHVLGDEERRQGSFATHCGYILQNPVRAKLAEAAHKWPYAGAMVPAYPKLDPHDEKFWGIFWKLYHQLRASDAASRRLLPRRAGQPL